MAKNKRLITDHKITSLSDRSGIYELGDIAKDKNEFNYVDDTAKRDYVNTWENNTERDPFYSNVAIHSFYEPKYTDHILKDKTDNHWDEYISFRTGRGQFTAGNYGPRYWHSTHFWTDYYSLTNCDELNFGNDDFTIEFWIKLSRYDTSEHYVMGKGAQAGRSAGTGWVIYVTAAGNIGWYDAHTGTSTMSAQILNRDQWYFVSFSRSELFSSGIQIYIDGQLMGAGISGGNLTNTNDMIIGRDRLFTSTTWFGGLLFDIRITKQNLYPNTYQLHYSPSTVPTGTVLLTGRNDTVTDSSGNNMVFTLNGDVTTSIESPFVRTNYSLNFDGNDSVSITFPQTLQFVNEAFTLELWAYPRTGTGGSIFSLRSSVDSTRGFVLYLKSDGTIQTDNARDGGTVAISTSGVTFNFEAWNHIAITQDKPLGTISYFINGKFAGTANGIYYSASSVLMVLAGTIYGTSNFNGYLSNLKFNLGERLYTVDFTPPAYPLTNVANTSLLLAQGNTLQDNSSNNITVNRFGDTELTKYSPDTNRDYSVCFDGSGDYLSFNSSPAFGLGTDDFTIECWIYTTSNPTNGPGTVADFRTGGTTTALDVRINNLHQLQMFNGPSNTQLIGVNSLIPFKTWTHIAITRENTTIKMYVNGILKDTHTGVTSNFGTFQPLRIGSNQTAGYDFYGFVSNFRIIKGQVYYTSNFIPENKKLSNTTQTTLLTCQSDAFIDNSQNNTRISVVGNTCLSIFSPFENPEYTNVDDNINSVYFNGRSDYLTLASSPMPTTGQFTFECWVQFFDSRNRMIIYSNHGSDSNRFNIGRGFNNTLLIKHGTAPEVIGNIYLHSFVWHHIAITRDSSNILRLFVNGVLDKSVSNYNYQMFNGNSRISGIDSNPEYYFNGYLSNLRVSNTARYTDNFDINDYLTSDANTRLLICKGSAIVDYGQNNITVTKYGSPAIAPENFKISKNMFANSIYLDGSGDYLTLGGQSNFAFGTNDFTVECWIQKLTTSAGVIYDSRPATTNGAYLYIGVNASKQVQVYVSSATRILSTTLIEINTWYHVAVTRKNSILSLFVNGVLQNTWADTTTYLNGTSRPSIGADGYTITSANFNGYISNLRVINGDALYDTAFIPSLKPLLPIQNTVLLTCQESTIIDRSLNNFTITVTGNTTTVISNPFVDYQTYTAPVTIMAPNNYSMYFDGSNDYLSVANNSAFALGSQDFTIEFWINTTQRSESWITGYYFSDPIDYLELSYIIAIYEDAYSLSLYSGSNEVLINIGATADISNGNWHHIACSRQGNTVRTFLDGVLSTTTAYANVLNDPSNAQYFVGGLFGIFEDPFNGYISNLRVVKGSALYTSSFTPSISSLTSVNGTSLLICKEQTIIDSSANNFTVTVNGDVSVAPYSPFNANGSNISFINKTYSTYFDGSGDFLTVADNANLELGSSDFTIETWIYLTIASGEKGIVSKYITGNVGYNIRYSGSGGGIRSVFGNSSGATDIWVETWTPSANTWYHVAFVRSSNSYYVFVNGIQIGTTRTFTNATTIGDQSADLLIGTTQTVTSSDFAGYMSNFRIVKGAAVYTSNFTPSAFPLSTVPGTVLLTCQSDLFKDYSANNFPITKNGNTITSRYRSPFITETISTNSSIYFDGVTTYLTADNSDGLNLEGVDFTIEFWMFANSTPNGNLIGKRSTRNAYGGIIISFSNSVFPGFLANLTASSWNVNTTSRLGIDLGSWNHLAVVRKGDKWRIYVNGKIGAEVLVSGSIITNTSKFSLGSGSDIGEDKIKSCYISNFRIVKGTALYDTVDFTPQLTPLNANENTICLTANKEKIEIQSTYDLPYTTVTVNGNTHVSTFNPFTNNTPPVNGKSITFDGTGDFISITDDPSIELGSDDFVIDFWAMPRINNSGTASRWLSKASGTGYTPIMVYQRYQYIYLYLSYAGTAWNIDGQSGTFIIGRYRPGEWNHIALARQGDYLQTFMNGKPGTKIGLPIGQTLWDNAFPWLIGAMSTGAEPVAGFLSNFRMIKGSENVAPIVQQYYAMQSYTVPETLLDMSNAAFHLSGKYPWHNATDVTTLTVTGSAIHKNPDTPFRVKFPLLSGHGYNSVYSKDSDAMLGFRDVRLGNTSLKFGTNPFTIEGWIYVTDNSKDIGICGKGTGNLAAAGATGWSLHINSTGFLGWADQASTLMISTTGPKVDFNTWNHFAAVREGIGENQFKLYLNGQLSYTGTLSTDYTDNEMFMLFGSRNEQYWFKYAKMSCFRVSLTARYTQSFDPIADGFFDQMTTVDNNTSLLTCTTGVNPPRTTGYNWVNHGYLTNLYPYSRTTMKEFGGNHPYVPSGYALVNHETSTSYPVVVATTVGEDFNFGVNDFTIEFWAKNFSNQWQSYNTLMDTREYFNDTGICIRYNQANGIDVITSGVAILSDNSVVMPPHSWVHICVQRASGALALYVNGRKLNEVMWNTIINSPMKKIYISNGSHPNLQFTNRFYGSMSDFRILRGVAAYTIDNQNIEQFSVPRKLLDIPSSCVLSTLRGPQVQDFSGRNVAEIGGRNESNFSSKWAAYVGIDSPYSPEEGNTEDNIYGTTLASNDWGYATLEQGITPNTELSRINRMTGPWTIEGWFFTHLPSLTSPTSYTFLTNGGSTTQNGFHFVLHYNGSAATWGAVAFCLDSEKSGRQFIAALEPDSNLRYHCWNHWAVQYDPESENKIALFMNGKRAAVRTTAFTAMDDIYTQSRLYSPIGGHSDVRISSIPRYNNDSSTYDIPTVSWRTDENTELLIKLDTFFEDSVNRMQSQQRGTLPSYEYTKWGKGSLHISNYRTAPSDKEYYFYTYGWWRNQFLDTRLSDFTIEGWACWRDIDAGGISYRSVEPGACLLHYRNSLWIGITPEGKWKFMRRTTTTTYDTVISDATIASASSGNFDFFVVQRYKGNYIFYINGVLVGVSNNNNFGTYSSNGPTTNLYDDFYDQSSNPDIRLGIDYNYSIDTAWCGYIEDFRVTTKARYCTKVINGVSTMCHIGTSVPALPTGPFPRK